MGVTLAAVVVGILVLAKAADAFVDGASALSLRWGLSPVVVGAVVIGFGTSAPELLVSGIAAAEGAPDVGIGNVIGSNVANMTLVLGIAGLVAVAGIAVSSSTIRREVPLSIGACVLFGWFLQGGLTRLEGVVMLLALAAALVIVVRSGRTATDPVRDEAAATAPTAQTTTATQDGLRTGLGLLGVVLGAQALVWGAERAADQLGLSGGFVGMTIVAVGTSMPEIVTSAKAAARGRSQLLVGNLLGSNMFNALAVGGVVALLAPGSLDEPNLTVVGVLAMVATSLVALAFMLSRNVVSRFEAAGLVVLYVVILPFLT